MGNRVLFAETQRFRLWWLWLALLAVNALFLCGIYMQIFQGKPFGDKPMSDTALFIATGLSLLMVALVFFIRLDTIIKKEGLYVRFFPFHIKWKFFPWDTVTRSYVREYSAIKEYGGWGIRQGILGKGKAYNVSGNSGLQLEFIHANKLLIGTSKPDGLTEILIEIDQLKLE